MITRKTKMTTNQRRVEIRLAISEREEGIYVVTPFATVAVNTTRRKRLAKIRDIVETLDGVVDSDTQEVIEWLKKYRTHWAKYWVADIDEESTCFSDLLGLMSDKEYDEFLNTPTIATKNEAVRILNAEVRKRAALLRRYVDDDVTDEELAQVGAFKAWVDEVIERMGKMNIRVKFQDNGYFALAC